MSVVIIVRSRLVAQAGDSHLAIQRTPFGVYFLNLHINVINTSATEFGETFVAFVTYEFRLGKQFVVFVCAEFNLKRTLVFRLQSVHSLVFYKQSNGIYLALAFDSALKYFVCECIIKSYHKSFLVELSEINKIHR